MYILTSVLLKTDVDMKIYMTFFFYNSYCETSVLWKTDVVIFMLTLILYVNDITFNVDTFNIG